MLTTKIASRLCPFPNKVHEVKHLKNISTTIAITVWGRNVCSKELQTYAEKARPFWNQ
jgi:hypothetical protein